MIVMFEELKIILLYIHLHKKFINAKKIEKVVRMPKNITKKMEDQLNYIFVLSIAVFLIIFWFLVIPSA